MRNDRFDLDNPSPARVFDYLLGGYENFKPDRDQAGQLIRLYPPLRTVVQEGREFAGRVVTWAARQGIGQFTDLGCGFPRRPPLHHLAREAIAGARVAYIDQDPVVLAHTDAFLSPLADDAGDGVTVIDADLTDPAAVLGDAGFARVIDLDRPVCVLLAMVLHFLDADTARETVAGYAARLAPGSVIAVSVLTFDEAFLRVRFLERFTAGPLFSHDPAEVRSFLDGLDLVEPGVVMARRWRGGMPDPGLRPDGPVFVLAGAARKTG